MDTKEAKQVFSCKTCTEISSKIHDELEIPEKERLSIADHGALGYMPVVARFLRKWMKEKRQIHFLQKLVILSDWSMFMRYSTLP